jgi:hypothetical protein
VSLTKTKLNKVFAGYHDKAFERADRDTLNVQASKKQKSSLVISLKIQ